jgi:hypothetical protein
MDFFHLAYHRIPTITISSVNINSFLKEKSMVSNKSATIVDTYCILMMNRNLHFMNPLLCTYSTIYWWMMSLAWHSHIAMNILPSMPLFYKKLWQMDVIIKYDEYHESAFMDDMDLSLSYVTSWFKLGRPWFSSTHIFYYF